MSVGRLNVQSPQRQASIVSIRKTGGATPALSGLCQNFCSIVRNGVGDYSILVNIKRPYSQVVTGVAMPHASGIIRLNLATTSKLQISIKCFAVDGITAAELDFDLIAMGSFAADLLG